MGDMIDATPAPARVRDLPPDNEPFTRCGFTCHYALPDGSPVTAADANNPGLGIAVRVRIPGRRETFLATIPAAGFRAMNDDEFTHTITVLAWQAHYGDPIDEADPCGRTSPLGPREPCVLPREHRWGHRSENGAEWVENGATYTLPWPKEHRQHPAQWMRRGGQRRLYACQGGKQHAMRAFVESLPEADRGKVRVFTRQDAEAAQRRRREALLAELRELDGQWFA